MAKNKAMSVRAADATEGGGINGARAVLTEVENVQEFQYPGRSDIGPQAALRVVYEIDGQEKPWEQHYPYGKSDRYNVIDDGDAIEGPGLNKGSNAYRWYEAAEEAIEAAGLDLDDFHGDGSCAGYRDKVVIIKNIKYETVGGDKKDLIVIGSFVDDEADDSKGKKSSSKTSKASSGKSRGSLEDRAKAMAKAVVKDEERVKKSDLPNLVFKANKNDADAKAIMQLCFKESFLADIPGVDYDKKKGILTPAEDADGDDE